MEAGVTRGGPASAYTSATARCARSFRVVRRAGVAQVRRRHWPHADGGLHRAWSKHRSLRCPKCPHLARLASLGGAKYSRSRENDGTRNPVRLPGGHGGSDCVALLAGVVMGATGPSPIGRGCLSIKRIKLCLRFLGQTRANQPVRRYQPMAKFCLRCAPG